MKELISDNDLINQQALETFRKYNLEQLIPVHVKSPGEGHKLILSTYGQIDEDHFYDPVGNQIVTVDHTVGSVTSIKGAEQEKPDVKKKRESLQEGCDKYVADRYLDGICTVFPNRDNPREFFITISCSKFNEENFWSGRWRSVYRVTFQSDTKIKISGSMKVNVHYYEKGNIQLNTSREYGDTLSASSLAKVGETIFKALEKSEGNFQDQIDSTCQNLTNIFKLLRRRLPITATKFDFNSLHHDLVKSYKKK